MREHLTRTNDVSRPISRNAYEVKHPIMTGSELADHGHEERSMLEVRLRSRARTSRSAFD